MAIIIEESKIFATLRRGIVRLIALWCVRSWVVEASECVKSGGFVLGYWLRVRGQSECGVLLVSV